MFTCDIRKKTSLSEFTLTLNHHTTTDHQHPPTITGTATYIQCLVCSIHYVKAFEAKKTVTDLSNQKLSLNFMFIARVFRSNLELFFTSNTVHVYLRLSVSDTLWKETQSLFSLLDIWSVPFNLLIRKFRFC